MVGREVGAGDEEELQEATVDDEERKPRVARIPRAPTAQEWDDHMSHHAEYRDWCPWCVQGKGIAQQHRQSDKEEEKIGVTVSMDWTYMNSAEDEIAETGPPTLVVHDNSTIAIWATARESKEIIDDLVDWVCNNLKVRNLKSSLVKSLGTYHEITPKEKSLTWIINLTWISRNKKSTSSQRAQKF